MSDKNEAEGEKKEGEATPKKSKKKLFIIIGVVVLLLGAGIPAALMLTAKEEPKEETEPVELEPMLETFQLDPIIVNLSESTSFLKVTLVIEYDLNILNAAGGGTEEGGGHGYGGGAAGGGDAKPAGPPAAISSRMHHIKDAVIRILSSKTAAEVLSLDGKESLKEELLEAINDATGLDEAAVISIYFLEFIIQ